MPPELEIALLGAAVLIGATGTWSPCGLSMIETIGPTGHTGGRAVALAACATFLPGALAGGLLTFGGLALAGSVIAGSFALYLLAAPLALVAAFAELRGMRIAPQVRRQLPEHWRRVMPMPLAAALYGILLGLGFTTFVLTFGVWALAGISLALGDPHAGLLVGLGFGLGRALPIVVLAPFADHSVGRSAVGLMGERPGLYRAIRAGDGVALLATAAALIGTAGAEASSTTVPNGADPSLSANGLVSQRGEGRDGELRVGRLGLVALPGTDPAAGGPWIAVLDGSEVALLNAKTLAEVSRSPATGADALAVSRSWLAYRTRIKGKDRIVTRRIGAGGEIGGADARARVSRKGQLSRPSLDGARMAYAKATSRRNSIVVDQLGTRKQHTALASRLVGLSNPALLGKRVLYVRNTRSGDQLRLHKLGSTRAGMRLLGAPRTRLWTTALSGKRAYVTRFKSRRAGARARIVTTAR